MTLEPSPMFHCSGESWKSAELAFRQNLAPILWYIFPHWLINSLFRSWISTTSLRLDKMDAYSEATEEASHQFHVTVYDCRKWTPGKIWRYGHLMVIDARRRCFRGYVEVLVRLCFDWSRSEITGRKLMSASNIFFQESTQTTSSSKPLDIDSGKQLRGLRLPLSDKSKGYACQCYHRQHVIDAIEPMEEKAELEKLRSFIPFSDSNINAE